MSTEVLAIVVGVILVAAILWMVARRGARRPVGIRDDQRGRRADDRTRGKLGPVLATGVGAAAAGALIAGDRRTDAGPASETDTGGDTGDGGGD